MFFYQLWPNNPNAPSSTTSGGFIEVSNCLIWCSTAHKVAGSTFAPPPLFTQLEHCALEALHFKYSRVFMLELSLSLSIQDSNEIIGLTTDFLKIFKNPLKYSVNIFCSEIWKWETLIDSETIWITCHMQVIKNC